MLRPVAVSALYGKKVLQLPVAASVLLRSVQAERGKIPSFSSRHARPDRSLPTPFSASLAL